MPAPPLTPTGEGPSGHHNAPSSTMLSTNPSHILIARNSRGPNNPSASLSSPTETHAAAAGIFRSSGSPSWLLEECDNDELVTELNLYESERAIEIDDTFTRRNGRFPGTVKIVVESTTFWWVWHLHGESMLIRSRAHKEVLFFASPFFEAALSGGWLETGRPPSMSSIITISQPPSIPGRKSTSDVPTAMSFTPDDDTHDSSASDTASDSSSPVEIENPPASESDTSESEPEQLESAAPMSKRKAHARGASLAKLQGSGNAKHDFKCKHKSNHSGSQNTIATVKRRRRTDEQDAVIVLKEEKASIFHDFLKFVYPQYVRLSCARVHDQ